MRFEHSPMGFTFPKSERIVSKKLIDELFNTSGSHSMVAFPIRVVYKVIDRSAVECTQGKYPQTPSLKSLILISVPKKRFKHAVDRNRVKRQVREAYRHQKHLLCDAIADNQSLLLGFVWVSDELAPSRIVNSRMERLLKRIAEKVEANTLKDS